MDKNLTDKQISYPVVLKSLEGVIFGYAKYTPDNTLTTLRLLKKFKHELFSVNGFLLDVYKKDSQTSKYEYVETKDIRRITKLADDSYVISFKGHAWFQDLEGVYTKKKV